MLGQIHLSESACSLEAWQLMGNAVLPPMQASINEVDSKMKKIYRGKGSDSDIPTLALKPAQAAKAMNVSERTLWSITVPRGTLPAVKIGSRVVYFPHQIQAWADRQHASQQVVETEAGK